MALRSQQQVEESLRLADRKREQRRAEKADATRRRQTAAADRRARRAAVSEQEQEAKDRWLHWHPIEQCEACHEEPAAQAHHAIREQVLRRFARDYGFVFGEVRWDRRLRILLCTCCHTNHTARSQRLPFSILRPETIALAEELGLGWSLDREYPVEAA
jgi:hypothetical protein